MSFIFGLVNLRREVINPNDIRTLCNAVKWDGFNDQIAIRDAYAFGFCWNKKNNPHAGILINERIALVCDARIYNQAELHQEISYNTPEEAFAEAYLKWGENFASKINGDFSVVVLDILLQKVLLIRDHIGVRPLCYSIKNDQLIFASHEFGIAKSNLINNKLSEEALVRTFHLHKQQQYDLTAFKHILKVFPGCSLSLTSTKKKYRKYWFPEKIKKNHALSFENAVEGLRTYLINATKVRMEKGLIGTHVSGGIDSTGIAAILADCIDDKNNLLGYSWSPVEDLEDIDGLNEKKLIEDFSKHKNVQINYLFSDHSTLIEDFILPEFEQMPIEIHTMRKACEDGVSLIFSGWGGDECVSLSLRGSINHIVLRFKISALVCWIKHFGIKATVGRAMREILPLFDLFSLFDSSAFKKNNRKYFKNYFILKHWNLFFLNKRKSLYGFGDRNGLMIKLLYNNHLAQRMDSWALFGEKYGIDYRFPLIDKQLLEFWFTIPIQYTYEGMIHRSLYREAMKGILNESVRMRTDKDEAVFQKNNKLRNQAIKEQLATMPSLFSESPHLDFFRVNEFKRNVCSQPSIRKIYNQQLNDIRFFLRYKALVEKYQPKDQTLGS